MKYVKIFMILLTFIIANSSLACDNDLADVSNSKISTWLGDNSPFSKAYKDGKCVLDKALINIPLEQRRVIANLIAKSYSTEIKNAKEILNYNY